MDQRPERKRLRYETRKSDLGRGGRALWLGQDTGRTGRQKEMGKSDLIQM